MIKVALFVVVFVAALACMSAGLPLWPVFLMLAGILLAASLRYGERASGAVALLMGVSILAMLVPFPEPHRWLYACILWTVLAACLTYHHIWAAFFALMMPLGYAGIGFGGFGLPLEGWWAVVEVCGVAALLSAGGPIEQLIGDMRSAVAGRGGTASVGRGLEARQSVSSKVSREAE